MGLRIAGGCKDVGLRFGVLCLWQAFSKHRCLWTRGVYKMRGVDNVSLGSD